MEYMLQAALRLFHISFYFMLDVPTAQRHKQGDTKLDHWSQRVKNSKCGAYPRGSTAKLITPLKRFY